jgi:hypothetical protein
MWRSPRPPSSPGANEIEAALKWARERLNEGEWYPCNTFKLVEEFERLGLDSDERRLDALRRAAAEVSASDYDEPPPPGLSDEPACRSIRMIPFVWQSLSFGTSMYFKFGIHRDGHLYVFSLHPSDFEKKQMRRR